MTGTSPRVVGLTGGIASGKSTVAARMRNAGVAIVDADQVAREIVEPGSPVLEAVRETFGDRMIQPDGTLDRAALGAHVFSDPEALKALNRLTHPAILHRAAEQIDAFGAQGYRWVVYEAALILENRLAPALELLVVVLCEPETQVQRIVARNGLTDAEARRRVAAQTDNTTRTAAADYLIANDGSLAALEALADVLLSELAARLGTARIRP